MECFSHGLTDRHPPHPLTPVVSPGWNTSTSLLLHAPVWSPARGCNRGLWPPEASLPQGWGHGADSQCGSAGAVAPLSPSPHCGVSQFQQRCIGSPVSDSRVSWPDQGNGGAPCFSRTSQCASSSGGEREGKGCNREGMGRMGMGKRILRWGMLENQPTCTDIRWKLNGTKL